MKINVVPLQEVNGVKFGMPRNEVRAILGEAREFKKSKFSKNTTDDFGYCHVFYDTDNQCVAVEIFSEAEVYISEKKIFPCSISDAMLIVSDLKEDSGSFISESQSIGIYAPNGVMESILFGKVDYYK